MRYYIPVNKVPVEVPKEYFNKFQPIVYEQTEYCRLQGIADFLHIPEPKCFVVRNLLKKLPNGYRAFKFYEKLNKDLNSTI